MKKQSKDLILDLTKKAQLGLIIGAALGASTGAYANWEGLSNVGVGTADLAVDAGNATITNVTVDQARYVGNLTSMSNTVGETTNVTFAVGGGKALFRSLDGGSPSSIYGTLSSNGALFLMNPNGILIGGTGSVVTLGGFTATTMEVDKDEFAQDKYNFTYATGGFGDRGNIINNGTITATDIAFMGSNKVQNNGTMNANNVAMTSSKNATLVFDSRGLVTADISGEVLDKAVEASNLGNIKANGGRVTLAASGINAAVNVDGVIEAGTLAMVDGVIRLQAIGENGNVSVTGKLDVSGDAAVAGEDRIIITADNNVNITNGSPRMPIGKDKGINIQAKNDISVDNWLITSGDGDITIQADSDQNNSGDLNLTNGLVSEAGNVVLSGFNVVGNNDKRIVTGTGDVSVTAGEDVNFKTMTVRSNGGDVEVAAEKNVFLGSKDTAEADRSTSIQTTGEGEIIVTANAGNVALDGKVIAESGDITIKAVNVTDSGATNSEQGISTAGDVTIEAKTDVDLQTTTITVASGNPGKGNVEITAKSDILLGASIGVAGDGSIVIAADSNNQYGGDAVLSSGLTSESGDITISGENVRDTAKAKASPTSSPREIKTGSGGVTITATKGVNLQATDIETGHDVEGSGELNITAQDDVKLGGDIEAEGDVTIKARRHVVLNGDIEAQEGAGINIVADSNNQYGGDAKLGGNLTSGSGDISISGENVTDASASSDQKIKTETGDVTITAENNVELEETAIESGVPGFFRGKSGGDITVTAGNDITLGGDVKTVRGDGKVTVKADADNDLDGDVHLNAGLQSAAGDITVSGVNVTDENTSNSGQQIKTDLGKVSVTASNNVVLQKTKVESGVSVFGIPFGGDIEITADRDVVLGDQVETKGFLGKITIKADADQNAEGDVVLSSGVKTQLGSVDISGENVRDTSGADQKIETMSGDVTITANNGVDLQYTEIKSTGYDGKYVQFSGGDIAVSANNDIKLGADIETRREGKITITADVDKDGEVGGDVVLGASMKSQDGDITITGENVTDQAINDMPDYKIASAKGGKGGKGGPEVESIQTGSGNVTIAANNDVNLQETEIETGVRSEEAGKGGNRNVIITANNDVKLGADIETRREGQITVTADVDNDESGDIALGASLLSENGDITLTAENVGEFMDDYPSASGEGEAKLFGGGWNEGQQIKTSGADEGQSGDITIKARNNVNLQGTDIITEGKTA